jgi:hypothetical protein
MHPSCSSHRAAAACCRLASRRLLLPSCSAAGLAGKQAWPASGLLPSHASAARPLYRCTEPSCAGQRQPLLPGVQLNNLR